MLLNMRIRDLGVIDDATCEFAPGLNVLTGETGAGKTMVVSGLGLLLGARADAGMVRAGAESAVVEGELDVVPDHPARAAVADAGGVADEDLLLSRSVSAQGRSRAHAGGRAVPIAVLAGIGHDLVAVHGQADQWRLRRPDEHRAMLDEFAGPGHARLLADYRSAYDELARLQTELERVRGLARDRTVEAEVLRAGLEELERVDPQVGEDDALVAEEERLAHADGLRAAAGQARDMLLGPDEDLTGTAATGAAELLAQARSTLEGAAGHDPALQELAGRAAELGYLAADLGTDLATYLDGVDADPVRLSVVQERRAELATLTRRYGQTCEDVLDWGRRAALRLAELDGAQDRAAELEAELATAREALAAAAAALSSSRRAAADELGELVTEELAHLAMGKARIDVAVERRTVDDGGDGLVLPDGGTPVRYGPTGVDDVEIRLAANPGAPPRSVAKAASGGELSRVMLAIEVVTGARAEQAAGTGVTTFVFDEVDAGVGGRAALDIGARLARLARNSQVLVVTHLAQVAAFADRHLVVQKADDGQVTSSGVRAVEGTDRLAELARMMAGGDSDVALDHASELLDQARRRREKDDAGRRRQKDHPRKDPA